jgi:hypothetical protein
MLKSLLQKTRQGEVIVPDAVPSPPNTSFQGTLRLSRESQVDSDFEQPLLKCLADSKESGAQIHRLRKQPFDGVCR